MTIRSMKTARMALNVGLCNNIGKCKVKKSQLRGLGLWRRPALKSQKYGKPTYKHTSVQYATESVTFCNGQLSNAATGIPFSQ